MLEVNLFFDGKCAEAMDFYKESLQALEIERITYGDEERDPFENDKHKAMISRGVTEICGIKINFRDNTNEEIIVGNNFSLKLLYDNEEAFMKAYEGLSKDGKVIRDTRKTYKYKKYARIKDKYSVIWELVITK